MALESVITIGIQVLGDGESTVFKFDLSIDPYTIFTSDIENWFTKDRKFPNPVNVTPSNPALGIVVLSGTVVTITFANPISNGTIMSFAMNVFFAGR